jgi:pyrroline-5-carboxylate reductase
MLGLIGSGNMGSALARGLGQPVIASDVDAARAQALVDELGGEVAPTNAYLAEKADTIVLAHKPAQLGEVAEEIGPATRGKLVISLLGGIPLGAVAAAYAQAETVRIMPNTPVQIRRGVVCVADGPHAGRAVDLLTPVGDVAVIPESLMDVAMATMSVSPAYVAVLIEAHVDAAVRRGLPAPLATRLAVGAFAGSAELVGTRDGDTLRTRREVTSPGGSTARGLAALEANGIRKAFDDAMTAVVAGA